MVKRNLYPMALDRFKFSYHHAQAQQVFRTDTLAPTTSIARSKARFRSKGPATVSGTTCESRSSLYRISNTVFICLHRSAIAFRTVERVENDEVELAVSQLILFTVPKQSTSSQASVFPPFSLPFSIPLTADIPQALCTPSSSITHTLVATLQPRTGDPIIKSTEVFITRYISAHASASDLSVDPVTTTVDSPSRASAQIPRSVYRVGEPIPLYVTIAPPERSAVASGLRLRNVKAELVRTINVRPVTFSPTNSNHTPMPTTVPDAEDFRVASTSTAYPPEKSPGGDSGYSTVLRRSGSTCRFHSTKQIKLRLILHDSESNASGTISQGTLLHQISFRIQITVAYTSGHSSPSSTTSIPIVVLPQVAPAHEGDFSQEVDSAYRKKHDPPPARTRRMEDSQVSGSSELPSFDDPFPSSSSPLRPRNISSSFPPPPSFSEASASTSYMNSTAPPSFEDAANTSTSTHRVSLPSNCDDPPGLDDHDNSAVGGHLPSFIESESEAAAAAASTATVRVFGRDNSFGYWVFDPQTERQALHFPGEGTLFGFTPAEQYDGLSHSMMQAGGPMDSQSDGSDSGSLYATTTDGGTSFHRASATHLPPDLDGVPPPGIDESIAAAVTAAFVSAGTGIGVTAASVNGGVIPPPPPPALDDPSDPPPSIDDGVHALSHAQQTRRERAMVEAAVARAGVGVVRGDAQDASPSMRIPAVSSTREEIRPPPYLGVPQAAAPTGPPPYNG